MRKAQLRLLLALFLCLFSAACTRSAGRDSVYARGEVYPPRKWVRIFVDPGHGGHDSGTRSLSQPVYLEKDLVLTTSLMLRKHLERMGYTVVLSRRDDTFIPLRERVSLAHANQANVFVSMHYNAATNRQAQGVEVFFYASKKQQERAKASKDLAENVLAGVLAATAQNSRGVKQGNFAVIRETDIPAVLVEGGFLSNDKEMERLRSPRYLNRIAYGIADGIDRHLYGAAQER